MRKSNKDILADLINKKPKEEPVEEVTRQDFLKEYKSLLKQTDKYRAYDCVNMYTVKK